MAFTITINFADDALASEIRNAYAKQFDYQDNVANPSYNPALPIDPVTNPVTIANPETKAQFRDRIIKREIKNCVKWYRYEIAKEAISIPDVAD
jgi:hypothetical protein